MTYTIRYSSLLNPKAVSGFPKTDLRKVKRSIEQKLTGEPDLFGKPLRRSLRGYWSLRVGNYRVIYRIRESEVLIFLIEHRSVVYETAKKFL
ncbi:MAG: type II toxin-antitoxin system RelE/ParE family toxin [Candidatus Peregrinibacteria bacterium]|nr:type II toxin-antitoxin system RelE/ParE family toxin [Candidatus Peregrinibacteria bacterium]